MASDSFELVGSLSTQDSGDQPILPTITRKKIGDLLQKYDPSKDNEPIDCFYFQGYTQQDDAQKMDKITKVVERFLQQRKYDLQEEWYKLVDWWPLTYFLDEEAKRIIEGDNVRSETDRELERRLNDDIREKLRAKLRACPENLDIPIILMRACKYNNWVDLTPEIS